MHKGKKKILVCVEGAKTDVRLMGMLFKIYNLELEYEIIPYCANIYDLYNAMFGEGTPEDMDFLQVLKEREYNTEVRKILDFNYSDILLIFDMDPQDPRFSPKILFNMINFFKESTDTGKLYINYPMVEAFYHLKALPDMEYNTRIVTMDELQNHTYKLRVSNEIMVLGNRYNLSCRQCNIIINQNIEINNYQKRETISVLCTCVAFIAEYKPSFLNEE